MSHSSDQPETRDQRQWREFNDRDVYQDRLTHELTTVLNDSEDW